MFVIGGVSGGIRDEVLKFDGSWSETGQMEKARYGAAATKIDIPGKGGFLDITACL